MKAILGGTPDGQLQANFVSGADKSAVSSAACDFERNSSDDRFLKVCHAAWSVVLGALMLGVAFPVFASSASASRGFIAHGAITMMMRTKDGATRQVNGADFEAVVNTQSNLYLFTLTSENPQHQIVTEQCGSDGIDHYIQIKVSSQQGEILATDLKVGSGLFPSRAYEFPQALWLLFVLDRLPTNDQSNAIRASRQLAFLADNEFRYEVVHTEGRRYADNPDIVQQIRYYNPGYTLGPDGKKIAYPPPSDKGFILACFEKGPLFHKDVMLPREATFTTYLQTHFITNRDDVPPFTVDRIVINSCDPYEPPASFLPPVRKGESVNDYRFQQELRRVMIYSLDSTQWLARSDAKLQTLLAAQKQIRTLTPTPKYIPRAIIIGVLLVLALIPFVVLFAKRIKTRLRHGS